MRFFCNVLFTGSGVTIRRGGSPAMSTFHGLGTPAVTGMGCGGTVAASVVGAIRRESSMDQCGWSVVSTLSTCRYRTELVAQVGV